MVKTTYVRVAMVLLSALLLTACENKAQNRFRFVFMTDIHLQPERGAPEGFSRAIDSANALSPDFVLLGGDLIMDAFKAPYDRSVLQYEMFTAQCSSFKSPVYTAIGNHELFAVGAASKVGARHNEYGKEMYRRRVREGRTYYSFDHKGWHFMVLDDIGVTPENTYIGAVDSAQLQWIRDDLAEIDTGTPIAVMLHIPLVSAYKQITVGGTEPLPPNLAVANSKELLELFENHNLRLVLQGHLHLVEQISYGSTTFITGGAVCGSWWRGPRDQFEEGFMVFDVEGDSISWRYVDYGWEAVESGN
ncbi:MAG: metallophosphoesterase [Chitinivibrionales bacterium]|nr:metallophosphoesterase [Chitinivibrionales bacterium]MBD3356158.1 metallophosphoesterase [Chitinivibrionales bacterium]